MEAAFAWIGQFVDAITQFIPRIFICDITRGAVKVRRGNEITELVPGRIYLYWPLISEVRQWPVVRQTIDLTTQTFETKDMTTLQVSGMITYQVNDVVALLTSVYEPDNAVRDIGMTVLQEVLVQYTWDEIRNNLVDGSLRKELVRETQRELKTYGIKVLKVGIKDLARTSVFKVALEQSTDGTH